MVARGPQTKGLERVYKRRVEMETVARFAREDPRFQARHTALKNNHNKEQTGLPMSRVKEKKLHETILNYQKLGHCMYYATPGI